MTNKEILEKAITKVIDGEWSGRTRGYQFVTENKDAIVAGITNNLENINYVIFNHDFAKALWGEELHHETFIVPKELNKRFAGTRHLDIKPMWQYHLQMMVVSDDPIRYLGENI